MSRFSRSLTVALGLLLLSRGGAGALRAQSDSVTVVPGPRYQAGKLHRWLLGTGYRQLWTTPIRVEVLDFTREKGGLAPVRRGGGVQTVALRFRAADGREYNFRSVDKELTPALPPYAQETTLDWIRQDVTSAQMPLAPIVVTPLLDAAGVLNPAPRLAVLPDHPALGEFREDFAGMLGTFEHHPNEVDEGASGFAGSVEVKGTEGMLEDVEESTSDRIDTRGFLTARLVDMLVGDWDRHEGQWRWARYDRDGLRWWAPIPEDRDYAFADYDGVLLQLARRTGLARLVSFDHTYPPLRPMMANSLELNRRLLADIPRAEWDSIAAFVQARITDEVIADAVDRVPPEVRDVSRELLVEKLRTRRDGLRALATRYYEFMAQMVEVHSTDEDEHAQIERRRDGSVEVVIATTEGVEVYRRTFLPSETREIRVDLHGGDDRAVIRGAGGPIAVRVLGGGGNDRLEDQGRGRTGLYDSSGENEIIPAGDTRVDRRSYEAPVDTAGLVPKRPRDWGRSFSIQPYGDWRSHAGVVVGGQAEWTRYGFRQDPYRSKHTVRAILSPESSRGALEYRALLGHENSDRWLELRGDATTLSAVRFHGFGNRTAAAGPESRVWLRELALGPRWRIPLGATAELLTGASLRYTDPSFAPASPVADLAPLGVDPFGQVQAIVSLLLDSRDDRWFPTRGYEAEITALGAPPVWDVERAYSRVQATGSTYLPLPIGGGPVLALRAGGTRVWGAFPFHESAFLGGSRTLRGFQRQRFAGDGMVFGNAELRVPITELEVLVRGRLGVSGLFDAGRVFMDGESPGGWHHAQGGSVWFATPALSLSLSYASGEGDRLYADIGLPF